MHSQDTMNDALLKSTRAAKPLSQPAAMVEFCFQSVAEWWNCAVPARPDKPDAGSRIFTGW